MNAAFASLPPAERQQALQSLTPAELAELRYAWPLWARPEQLIPRGDWRVWLCLAGRGWGKTRVGGETVRQWAKQYPFVNIIGATTADVRDICVLGESGILACCPPHERPEYVSTRRCLDWPNGSRSLLFSADEADRLRGPQHSCLWLDELASWRYQREVWDMAQFGLRLPPSRAIVSTTPKPTPLIKELLASPTTVLSRGTTFDNRINLSGAFLEQIIGRYEGTRLGRQELLAELLSDNPGALWKREMIDSTRVAEAPALSRIVIGVDPAVTSREDSDLTGIIVAALGPGKQFYVLDDLSLRASPDAWAAEVVRAYRHYGADRVVAERNNGGDLVESVLRSKAPNLSFKSVVATRGKAVRAEPIAALYEQGRVHHVGSLPEVEDELCDYNPASPGPSPDRLDAAVWALTELADMRHAGGGVFQLAPLLHAGQFVPIAPVPWFQEDLEETLRDEEQCRRVERAALGQRPCPRCASVGHIVGSTGAECTRCHLKFGGATQ